MCHQVQPGRLHGPLCRLEFSIGCTLRVDLAFDNHRNLFTTSGRLLLLLLLFKKERSRQCRGGLGVGYEPNPNINLGREGWAETC